MLTLLFPSNFYDFYFYLFVRRMTGFNSQKFQLKIEKEKNLLKGLQRGIANKVCTFAHKKVSSVGMCSGPCEF